MHDGLNRGLWSRRVDTGNEAERLEGLFLTLFFLGILQKLIS